jgi:heme/copper-type cytochrome/quinol oxidase subunit 4
MTTLRVVEIIGWLALPTVMYGGYSLLGLIGRDRLTPFQQTYFRAGHAHAGVLLLMSLLYFLFLERTHLAPGLQLVGAVAVIVGVLAQSGGFFLHMGIGQPGRGSLGTTVTSVGALILVAAILLLVYGLIVA